MQMCNLSAAGALSSHAVFAKSLNQLTCICSVCKLACSIHRHTVMAFVADSLSVLKWSTFLVFVNVSDSEGSKQPSRLARN